MGILIECVTARTEPKVTFAAIRLRCKRSLRRCPETQVVVLLNYGLFRIAMFAVAAKYVVVGGNLAAEMYVGVVLRSMMLHLENIKVQEAFGEEAG